MPCSKLFPTYSLMNLLLSPTRRGADIVREMLQLSLLECDPEGGELHMAKCIPHNGVLDLGLPRSLVGQCPREDREYDLSGCCVCEGRLSDSRDVIP